MKAYSLTIEVRSVWGDPVQGRPGQGAARKAVALFRLVLAGCSANYVSHDAQFATGKL
jgi:hypothetical protein